MTAPTLQWRPETYPAHTCACALYSGAIVMLLPQIASACSGPGAMEQILRAERMGWLLFGATGVLALLSALLLRRWQIPWSRVSIVAVPILVHPGWWLSARGGDCGTTRLLGSIGATAITAVALAVALTITALRRRR